MEAKVKLVGEKLQLRRNVLSHFCSSARDHYDRGSSGVFGAICIVLGLAIVMLVSPKIVDHQALAGNCFVVLALLILVAGQMMFECPDSQKHYLHIARMETLEQRIIDLGGNYTDKTAVENILSDYKELKGDGPFADKVQAKKLEMWFAENNHVKSE